MTTSSITTTEIGDLLHTDGPVALHLRQSLQPVEGTGTPFFPATYAGIGYQLDTLSDGTKLVSVDSVGSQANRIEPIFEEAPYDELVPQITVRYGAEESDVVSLLRASHRLGDAIVRCTELGEEAESAFRSLDRGDAEGIARIAPTSLIFGVWDSRETGVKAPRIVQSTIRAHDVEELTRSAQYTPTIDYASLEVVTDDETRKAEKGMARGTTAERGYVHVPAVRTHGGVIARGPIQRDVTLNLIRLRALQSPGNDSLGPYLLGLALVAATAPLNAYLRQGCMLVPDLSQSADWQVVDRSGGRTCRPFDHEEVVQWAGEQARAFGVAPPREVRFDKKRADADKTKKKKQK